MPIDPSFLPWWGWLLCGVVGMAIAAVAALMTTGRAWFLAWLIGMVAGLGGFIAFAVGLIRFVRWAWS